MGVVLLDSSTTSVGLAPLDGGDGLVRAEGTDGERLEPANVGAHLLDGAEVEHVHVEHRRAR